MLAKFIDNAREDSLTAAVFSHLLHLPIEMFWRILKLACYSDSLPDKLGEPSIFHPWPKWNPAGAEPNNTYVEPDIFMRFPEFDLIVEAKRDDNGTQDPAQWQRELIAYTNEYGKENRTVRMIALGGIHSEKDEILHHQWREAAAESNGENVDTHHFNCPVHMCRWSTVLLECQRLKKELEDGNRKDFSSRTSADIRMLNDLTIFFAAHGYAVLRWFDDFDFTSNFLSPSVESDRQYFSDISLRFQSL